MINPRSLPVLLACALGACAPSGRTTAFTSATVWDGTGSPAVENATILVQDGRVVRVEAGGSVPRGAQAVDLSGKWVIPGLINTHGHVTGDWAPDGVRGEPARIRGDLELYARYGITTVNSLGDGDDALAVRDQASPTDLHARLFAAGEVITATDPEGARAAAIANANAHVDWLKLRVDDNLGTTPKMPWDAVQAVFDVADERGMRVATHVFYLEDAKRLLGMGSDLIAHSVRDTDVDADFISQLLSGGVCYVPTLTREVSTFVYDHRPDFFEDPFFQRYADASEVERLSDPDEMQAMAESPMAAGYRVALHQAMLNLKALSDAGVSIAMGTDTGPAGRFPGYFEHLELWMMVDAGLSPEAALRSATGVAAACLGADGIGTLRTGKWADFLVLGSDPFADIHATRTLERVYIAGREMPAG